MKKSHLFLFTLIFFAQIEKGFSFEESYTQMLSETYFDAASKIIEKHCISCHVNNYHSDWANYEYSSNWINVGLVSPGNFENSQIVKRLKNYGGDMPTGGSSLSLNELKTLRAWIESLESVIPN